MPLLHWLTRERDIALASKAPYRLLTEHAALSKGDGDTRNMLIQGDNLEALKGLLPYYAGRVKCIFIDPPYNTKSAFEQYDDNLEHSEWLCMMYPRLELLRTLLSEEGSIWVTIDDNEAHYLKVIMDEVFGRPNFVTTVIWEKRTSRENRRVFSFKHDYVLVYAQNRTRFEQTRNLLTLTDAVKGRYKNPDNDPRGPWQSVSANAMAGHGTASQFYKLKTPSGKLLDPPAGRCWLYTEARMNEEIANGNIWFGKKGTNKPRIKHFLDGSRNRGLTPETIWKADEVGTNDSAKKDLISLFDGNVVFDTPKPEGLIQRILEIATNPGDLVLDSFAGSGTTGAVAHKMGRAWIMVESGEHCQTAVIPRLAKVIDGKDQTGVTAATNWKGGGAYRFYELAQPVFDETGRVNSCVRFPILAAHIWFSETGQPMIGKAKSPLLGVHDGKAYYLLFNGILGDKRPDGGNVLTAPVLVDLPPFDGPKIIFGEKTLFGPERLNREHITFRQIPYEMKVR
jgi:adenine-specific DNA-methyltransferase